MASDKLNSLINIIKLRPSLILGIYFKLTLFTLMYLLLLTQELLKNPNLILHLHYTYSISNSILINYLTVALTKTTD